MAKVVRRKDVRRRAGRDESLPLGKTNFLIMGGGVGVTILGYLAMAEGSVEGTLPLVVAPILLVLGYCVLIPLGILYKKSYIKPEPPPARDAR
ncbi:MAG: hypothetical protein WB626_13045 [Bacteroidota bacterium]